MSKLALLGGTPIRDRLFPAYSVLGVDERDAVSKVIDSQILSKYIGGHHPDFGRHKGFSLPGGTTGFGLI